MQNLHRLSYSKNEPFKIPDPAFLENRSHSTIKIKEFISIPCGNKKATVIFSVKHEQGTTYIYIFLYFFVGNKSLGGSYSFPVPPHSYILMCIIFSISSPLEFPCSRNVSPLHRYVNVFFPLYKISIKRS